MNMKQERKHIVDVLFVLALFVVFTLSALVLVILGANVYRQTVRYMDENYNARTAYSYLTEKVRQNDLYDSISIGELEGGRPCRVGAEPGNQRRTLCHFSLSA